MTIAPLRTSASFGSIQGNKKRLKIIFLFFVTLELSNDSFGKSLYARFRSRINLLPLRFFFLKSIPTSYCPYLAILLHVTLIISFSFAWSTLFLECGYVILFMLHWVGFVIGCPFILDTITD